jgi:uncharacterized membrane protein
MTSSIFGISPILYFILCVVWNLLPVPFILMFIKPIIEKIKNKKIFVKFIDNMKTKIIAKKIYIEKYEFIGLIFFILIPFPGTGSWTGAIISSILDMDRKKAMLSITIGVVISEIINTFFSFWLFELIFK